jgi:NAD(P)-dependent dehydrogenase (short-subunit alcohol dehydrogenase family)
MTIERMTARQRRVVVVGAASGIGAATAAHFHARGDYVLAVDRRQHQTPASEYVDCDLSKPEQISDLAHRIGGGWNILAHVAGVPGTAPAVDVLKINYLGMRLMVEHMLLLMAHTPEAVEKWCAREDPTMAYYTSKQALILYTKRIAAYAWANYQVRANIVSPGPVETTILADFEATMGREALEAARRGVGRHATVADVVPVIDFLTSEQAGWINGQDVQVDGGYIASLITASPA